MTDLEKAMAAGWKEAPQGETDMDRARKSGMREQRSYAPPRSDKMDDQALGLETGPLERRGVFEAGFPGDVYRAVGPESKRLEDLAAIETLKDFAGHVGRQSLGGLGGAVVGRGLAAATPASREAVELARVGGGQPLSAIMENPAETVLSKLLGTVGANVTHGGLAGALIGQATGHNPLYSAVVGAMLRPALNVASRAATPGVMDAIEAAAPSAGQAIGELAPSAGGPGLLLGLPGLPVQPDFKQKRPQTTPP